MGSLQMEFIGWPVEIPDILPTDGGKQTLEVSIKEPKTLPELFRELSVRYPQLIKDIYDIETGKMNTHLNLFLNGELIIPATVPDIKVKDGDSLTILVLLAGG